MSILNTARSHSQSIPQAIRLRKAAQKSVLVLGHILGLIIAVLVSLPVILLPFTTAVPAWAFVLLAAVARIDVKGKQSRGGVLSDRSYLEADAVLANADLLPEDGQARQLVRKRFSCSVISFFWGVDKPYKQLPPHTLLLADDYSANFDSIIRDLDLTDNPSLYVYAPARHDPSMAPIGRIRSLASSRWDI